MHKQKPLEASNKDWQVAKMLPGKIPWFSCVLSALRSTERPHSLASPCSTDVMYLKQICRHVQSSNREASKGDVNSGFALSSLPSLFLTVPSPRLGLNTSEGWGQSLHPPFLWAAGKVPQTTLPTITTGQPLRKTEQ